MVLDYDRFNNYKYYGIDNFVNFQPGKDYEVYTREQIEISFMLSRGFSENIVAEAGVSYKTFNSFNFESEGALIGADEDLNKRKIKFLSLRLNSRFDTRNSFINPSSGIVFLIESEYSFKSKVSNQGFFKAGINLQNYSSLFHPDLVLASRIISQLILPGDVPMQIKLPLGGNRTIRGLPQDRYLSASTLIINNEFRFPLWWKFGAVVGLDIGTTLSKSSFSYYNDELSGWIVSPAAGLRFYMDNFLVRLDVGFSDDYLGVYFNFGHMF